jgi:hypothetical protein
MKKRRDYGQMPLSGFRPKHAASRAAGLAPMICMAARELWTPVEWTTDEPAQRPRVRIPSEAVPRLEPLEGAAVGPVRGLVELAGTALPVKNRVLLNL